MTPITYQDSYYMWKTRTCRVQGQILKYCTKPGIADNEATDQAQTLLADHIEVKPGEDVLSLNCGNGIVGVVAKMASQGGTIWLADGYVVATEAARRTLKLHDITDAKVFESSGTKHLGTDRLFDVVTIRLPKGKRPALQLLLDGYNALRQGGRLYLAGANNEGIKSHLRHVDSLFGSSVLLRYRKGCRVAVAIRPDEAPPLPAVFQAPWLDHDFTSEFSVSINGRTVQVCTMPGVFSAEKLDEGTATLVEYLDVSKSDRILDLGCGNGLLGSIAAFEATEGSVTLVDADVNAIDTARKTIALNRLANCSVSLSDCISALRIMDAETLFDVVVTNPPFHQGKLTEYDVGAQFVRGAATVLNKNGRLLLVANHFLNYETQMQNWFGVCNTLFRGNKYKVLEGRNPIAHV